MRKCKNCSSLIRDDDKYCRNCGILITSDFFDLVCSIFVICIVIGIVFFLVLLIASYLV